MGWKNFYYKHKKATSYMLILVLLTGFFYGFTRLSCFYYWAKYHGENRKSMYKGDTLVGEGDVILGGEDVITILALINEGKSGNLPAIAHLFAYPIIRPYPLPPIEDSTEFVRYGKIIFDDSLRQVLSETTLDDWEEWGWRGVFLHDYFAESGYDGGKVTSILYESKEEEKLKKLYLKEEIESLHPSLQEEIDVPEGTYFSADSLWICRLDLLKSGVRRFSLYKKGDDLSELPCFMGTESCYRIEGSAGNVYAEFVNDSVKIQFLFSPYENSAIFGIEEMIDLTPGYWRDLR